MDFLTPGYEDLELSTQLVIGEALKRGHVVEVLDRRDQFIRISGTDGAEYIKQATRTGVDTYIAPLNMENKVVTKRLLAEAGIRVPDGSLVADIAEAEAEYHRWKDRSLVIKPNTTNFGKAVSMFPDGASPETYLEAVGDALKEDDSVVIEEFFPGREYRFLVIGDQVRGVLHRVPANVVGDGRSDIRELVRIKNDNPLRGKGYVSPLEEISIGDAELAFLSSCGRNPRDIPEAGETVYLRKNSNISTGGDSIDFTDAVHHGYKELAVAASAAVGARICGADMIIPDINSVPDGGNYGFIELNFNPALHIHDFPFRGRNRHVERYVLDLLGL